MVNRLDNALKWEQINIDPDGTSDPRVLLGSGKIIFTQAAIRLLENKKIRWAEIYKTKIHRVTYYGFHFIEKKTSNSIKVKKDHFEGEKVFIIDDFELTKALYGSEAINDKKTFRFVMLSKDLENSLVIGDFYKRNYSTITGSPIRKRHIGTILDDVWLIERSYAGETHPVYVLKNIFTNRRIEISSRAVNDIEKGLTSVNNILSAREIGITKWRAIKAGEKSNKSKFLKKKYNIENDTDKKM